MNRPDLFLHGNVSFTTYLAEIADNTKSIAESLKRPRTEEEPKIKEISAEPERLVVVVKEEDGDFLYIYWKNYDTESKEFLQNAKRTDLSGRVIGANDESAGDWTMALFDGLSDMTSKFYCAVFHFL